MFYLILKYSFLFALAALFGFLFGRWWSRRAFVDITHDYASLSRAADAPWDRVWKRFEAVESSVRDARKDLPAGLEVLQNNLGNLVDQRVNTVRSGLAELDSHVRARSAPVTRSDLAPLEQRFAALEQVLQEIPRTGASVDLSPLENRLSTLSAAVAQRTPVDLTPIEQRIASMEQALRSPAPPELPQAPDLAPLQQRIEALEKTLSALQPDAAVDAASIDERLTRIERSLASLQTPPRTPVVARDIRKPARQTPAASESAANLAAITTGNAAGVQLLESAKFGAKDNLKQISGIGPKLERVLNQRGVYYFWQVAEWNMGEIQTMDELLDAFRGRIERDNWVAQARRLIDSGKAAPRPRT